MYFCVGYQSFSVIVYKYFSRSLLRWCFSRLAVLLFVLVTKWWWSLLCFSIIRVMFCLCFFGPFCFSVIHEILNCIYSRIQASTSQFCALLQLLCVGFLLGFGLGECFCLTQCIFHIRLNLPASKSLPVYHLVFTVLLYRLGKPNSSVE